MDETWICSYDPETKINLRSGDRVVHLNQKRFNTGVNLQAGGICFWGLRWDTVVWLLQEGCNNHSKLLHVSFGQSRAGTGHQTAGEVVEMSVVSPGQCLSHMAVIITEEVGWSPPWIAVTPCLFNSSRPFRLPCFLKLKKTSEGDKIFYHWGCHVCCRWLVCSPNFSILSARFK